MQQRVETTMPFKYSDNFPSQLHSTKITMSDSLPQHDEAIT